MVDKALCNKTILMFVTKKIKHDFATEEKTKDWIS